MGTREFIAFFFTSALFFSCASTGVSGGVSTFVDTTLSEDNSVNTSCVFTEIHSVSYVDGTEAEAFHLFGSGSGVVIPKKSYSYDSESGTIVFSDESALKSGRVFRIRGEYENPPVIILNGNVSGEPLVMVGGKKLVSGVGFDYDPETLRLSFRDKLDIDSDSFVVCWFSELREHVFGNKRSMFAKEYDEEFARWCESKQN